MSWQVETTTEFDTWLTGLAEGTQDSGPRRDRGLEEVGPTLGRPLVDSVAGSRHSNLKELRVRKTIRILFAFNRRQRPVLLIGGDKAGQTKRWYAGAIRDADRLFDELQ